MYIFDIDGTLADPAHRIHLIDGSQGKNWSLFKSLAHMDTPIQDTIDLMTELHDENDIVLCTGRSEDERGMTEQWLNECNCWWDDLYMRPSGDHRPDTIVKAELYKSFKGKYIKCLGVFEDRTKMVKMWRDLGLVCYQCRPGDY